MAEKVAAFGILRFTPEAMPRVLPHLADFVETTRANDGCIAYDVAEDLSDPGLIRFSELWPSQESLEAHLLAAGQQKKMAFLSASSPRMELLGRDMSELGENLTIQSSPRLRRWTQLRCASYFGVRFLPCAT